MATPGRSQDRAPLRRAGLRALWGLALAVLLVGCGGGSAPSEDDGGESPTDGGAVAGTPVAIENFAFDPGTLTIAVGDTVTWTNNDSAAHTATADDGSFDSGNIEQGESFSHTFDEAGTYTYVCTFHPNMTGEIVVE